MTTTTPETPAPAPKYSAEWAKDTADRVVSTGAQAAIATLGVGATGLLDINWAATASLVGAAMLLAALKALAIAKR